LNKKKYTIELTEETANVNDIKKLIRKKVETTNPVLLNCNFEKIENNSVNKGIIPIDLKIN
jgi:hypothetical protein